MAAVPNFPGFDGLLALSRHEGVDIRPTLLRVLTDLYVQTPAHTSDEEKQYTALASRLIEGVDDATRAMVRGRLAVYPRTPAALARQLGLLPAETDADAPTDIAGETQAAPMAESATAPAPETDDGDAEMSEPATMTHAQATQLCEMFFAANSKQRALILRNLEQAPAQRPIIATPIRLARARHNLEEAASIGDTTIFTSELADILTLPSRIASQIVHEPGGELLACAIKAVGLSQSAFERVLLFLDSDDDTSVERVFRLTRLYRGLTDHAALVMLSALRDASHIGARPRHTPLLHDDERQRARSLSAPRLQPLQYSAAPRKTVNGE